MKRVTGIGGIFLSAKNPETLGPGTKRISASTSRSGAAAAFRWVDDSGAPIAGTTAWSVGDGSSFAPSKASFMVNY